MLQLPNGTWTNTLDETYAHLLEVHFTGCTRISDNILQQVPKRAPFFNCNEVRRIVTEDRIKWAFGTMAPYKTPGQDGIYPALLQKGCESLLYPICSIYRASLSTGYIPQAWRKARVTFVPKPGKIDYTLAVFFDIQGAFDNTPITAIKKALHERQVISAIRNWIGSMIEQRTVCVNIGPTMIHIAAQRELPQGGELSPTLWSMVADSLLILLNRQGVFAQGFADDGVVIIIGKVLSTLCEIMQRILCNVESSCSDREISQ